MSEVTPKFSPGDLVAVSSPVTTVFTVTTEHLEDACYHCLSIPRRKLPLCTGCRFVRYCAQDCQKRDWKLRHKDECAFLMGYAQQYTKPRGMDSGPIDYFLLLVKIIAKLKSGKKMDIVTYRQYPGRNTDTDPVRDFATKITFKNWAPAIRAIDPKSHYHSDFDAFSELYSKLFFNGANIVGIRKDNCQVAEGLALYEPGVFGTITACNRNIMWYSQDKQLFVKATKTINVGEPLIFSQLSPFASTKDRRFRYGEVLVQCSCDACNIPAKEAERNAFRCGTQGCNNGIPLDERSRNPCEECGRLNSDRLQKAAMCVNGIKEALDTGLWVQRFGAGLRGTPQACAALILFLVDAEKILHPTNFTLGLCYKMGFQIFIAAGMEEHAVKCAEKMLLPTDTHTDPYLEEPIRLLPTVVLYYSKKGELQLAQKHLADFRTRVRTVYAGNVEEMRTLELLEEEVSRCAAIQ